LGLGLTSSPSSLASALTPGFLTGALGLLDDEAAAFFLGLTSSSSSSSASSFMATSSSLDWSSSS